VWADYRGFLQAPTLCKPLSNPPTVFLWQRECTFEISGFPYLFALTQSQPYRGFQQFHGIPLFHQHFRTHRSEKNAENNRELLNRVQTYKTFPLFGASADSNKHELHQKWLITFERWF
jgi:hypothetical protein